MKFSLICYWVYWLSEKGIFQMQFSKEKNLGEDFTFVFKKLA